MFVGTLTRVALQLLSKILEGTIDLFQTFSHMFMEQFFANKVALPHVQICLT